MKPRLHRATVLADSSRHKSASWSISAAVAACGLGTSFNHSTPSTDHTLLAPPTGHVRHDPWDCSNMRRTGLIRRHLGLFGAYKHLERRRNIDLPPRGTSMQCPSACGLCALAVAGSFRRRKIHLRQDPIQQSGKKIAARDTS